MKVLRLEDINFKELTLLTNVSYSESALFVCGDFLYKLYNDIGCFNREQKLELLFLKNGLANVVIPTHKIIDKNSILVGCVMPYIRGANPLFDINDTKLPFEMYLEIIKNISETLKQIHNNQIILGDFSFDNIIIDACSNHYFVDVDCCSIGGFNFSSISTLLSNFFYNMCLDYSPKYINTNTDRLAFLLSFWYKIFEMEIYFVSNKLYAEKAEQIKVLNDIKIFFEMLVNNKYESIPDIPYLGDCFTLKKNK